MFGMLPFERSDDNLFDTFDNFTRNFFRGSNASLPAFRTDIRDAGDKFVLEAELPGFDKGDIKLDVKDGILTITAEHSENQEQKDAKGAYIRRERRYGSFSRSFDITGIDEGSITAAYNNGILELNLPKAVPVVPESPPSARSRSPAPGAAARGEYNDRTREGNNSPAPCGRSAGGNERRSRRPAFPPCTSGAMT